jgi:DNA-binding beta-propeller fold protein YncE
MLAQHVRENALPGGRTENVSTFDSRRRLMTIAFVGLYLGATPFAIGCKPKLRNETAGASVSIAPAHALYVTNNGSDTLAVIDRFSASSALFVPIDLAQNRRAAPHHIAIDPATNNAFIALAFPDEEPRDGHAAHGRSGTRGRLARLDLRTLAVRELVEVEENPGDVALALGMGSTPTRVLVTHFDMRRALVAASENKPPNALFASLQVWDLGPLRKFGERPLCVAPHGMAVSSDGATAYVACYGSDELAIVGLADRTLPVVRIPVGGSPGILGAPRYGPYSATLSPEQDLVLVTTLEGQDARLFDVKSRTFRADVSIGFGARAMMPAFTDATHAIVPLQAPDGFARIDIRSGLLTARVTATAHCEKPHALRVLRDQRAYAVCEGDHKNVGSVVELDPINLTERSYWPVGVFADGIGAND